MDEKKIKNYLNIAIVIGIAVLIYTSVSYVNSYSKSVLPSSFKSFSASGEGSVVAIPDVAITAIGVITQGSKNIKTIQEQNSEKMNAVIEFLKANGIEPKDIKTQYYNLEPRYQYCDRNNGLLCPPPTIVGYSISQNISVKIRDFGKIGDILSGVVDKGANSVSQISFEIDEPEKYNAQARAEAIQKAKEKAKSVATAAGFKLGELLSIDEGYQSPGIYGYGMGGESLAIKSAPTIEPGSQKISVSVTLRYEMK